MDEPIQGGLPLLFIRFILAMLPIIWLIVAALFTYNLTMKTGEMEQIKKMLASVSKDKRVLALIIG